jgi:two-component system cell cycle sensor histidine kinase/response regulator CckA
MFNTFCLSGGLPRFAGQTNVGFHPARFSHELAELDFRGGRWEADDQGMDSLSSRSRRPRAQRNKAEERTLEALNFNRTMLEASPMGILTHNAEGQCISVNEAAARLVGATVEQMKEQNFRQIESWKYTGLLASAEEALATGRDVEMEVHFVTTFKKEVWLAFRFVPFLHEHRLHLLTMFSDIAERKRAELALSESEQRFRQLAENIREVFWMTDPEKTRMLYVSPAYEAVWGRSCESLYENPRGWIEAIHPEDRERVLHAALNAQSSGEYDETYRVVRPDGSIRWISDRAFPILNEAGEVFRIVGTAEDVTAQRSLEEQLLQAQKMEAIGLLAGGVAHDFNNLLTVINGFSEILLEEAALSEENAMMLKEIQKAGERATNLTRQLLMFSRKQVAHMHPVSLNAIVTDLVKLLRRLIGEDVSLNLNLGAQLPRMTADVGMVEQVIMNLSVNARDAMPEGGELSISTTAVTISETEALKFSGARAGEFISLSVRDTGSGIPPEIMTRIFEPFFTTKEVGKGTGLGLATVFGIVKQHGGWVTVESQPGQGATFRAFFPIAALVTETQTARRVDKDVAGGGESILLVEDEITLRNLAAFALSRLGYKVHQAKDGPEALIKWEEADGEIDLLFTDMIMPGGYTGRKLAEKLLEEKPSLKVIYSSGYNTEMAGQVLTDRENKSFLQKPYNPQELAKTVRHCLDSD